jgi:hypothetical protein
LCNLTLASPLSHCSSNLVGTDVVVTAGHCFGATGAAACDNLAFVFGYVKPSVNEEAPSHFDPDQVYFCKRILPNGWINEQVRAGDPLPGADFAVIQLDRSVVIKGRAITPLPVASSTPPVGTEVVMFGYGSQLALKRSHGT